jgi:redox-sensitive bicupin YhaK (pirin superfamily)
VPRPSHRRDLPTREISMRTRGKSHGSVVRLMSPGDLGETLKPFVFLDLFDNGGASFGGFGLHPHSGIATLTYLLEGGVHYEDTTGASGLLPNGGVEWMQAGGGVWHGGRPADAQRTRGFQLWIALPPSTELGPSISAYLGPADVPQVGPAHVLLGEYSGLRSPISAPLSITYLGVRMRAGETWSFDPPAGYSVLWIAVAAGAVSTPEKVEVGEMAAFELSDAGVVFHALTDTEFVLGSAAPHPHDLVLGYYSVHTSAEALRSGEEGIAVIEQRLIGEGRLPLAKMR